MFGAVATAGLTEARAASDFLEFRAQQCALSTLHARSDKDRSTLLCNRVRRLASKILDQSRKILCVRQDLVELFSVLQRRIYVAGFAVQADQRHEGIAIILMAIEIFPESR